MNDRELCEMFGTTLEEMEADAEKYEKGDFSDMRFGEAIDGRPQAKMKTTSFKLFDFELAAIGKAAEREHFALRIYPPRMRQRADRDVVRSSISGCARTRRAHRNE